MLKKSGTFTLIDNEQDLNLKKVKQLGRGAYGQVWLVKNMNNQYFALKILNLSEKKSSISQIRQEIQILQTLDHPNIVSFNEAFLLKDGRVFILMEHMEGGNLKEFIQYRIEQNKEITDFEKSVILKQILEAIQYIHDKQIIHRDLKLENILLKRKSDVTVVKLADFGISQKFEDNIGLDQIYQFLLSIHSNSQAGGTRSFMPPEIFNGQPYGKSVDIWSSGIIFFMLCSYGRHPFLSQNESHEEIMEKLKHPTLIFPGKEEEHCRLNQVQNKQQNQEVYKQIEKQQVIKVKGGSGIAKFRKLSILMKNMNETIDYAESSMKRNYIKINNKTIRMIENFTELAIDLITKMCAFEPSMRYSIAQILNHPWITRTSPWKIPLTNNELLSSFENTQKFTQILTACMIIAQLKKKEESSMQLPIDLNRKPKNQIPQSPQQFQIRQIRAKCSTTKNKMNKFFTPQQPLSIPIIHREPQKYEQHSAIKNNKYFIQQDKMKSTIQANLLQILNSNIKSHVNFAKVQYQKYGKRYLCFQ